MSTKSDCNLPGVDFPTRHGLQTAQLGFGPILWARALHSLGASLPLTNIAARSLPNRNRRLLRLQSQIGEAIRRAILCLSFSTQPLLIRLARVFGLSGNAVALTQPAFRNRCMICRSRRFGEFISSPSARSRPGGGCFRNLRACARQKSPAKAW